MTRQDEERAKAAAASREDASSKPAETSAASEADGTQAARGTLEEQFEALQAEKEEQFRGWQRTQADFTNYRRRTEQERVDLLKSAEAGLIHDLLPVLDDLERAIASLPADLQELTWVRGVLLIERKLAALLEQRGLK